MGMQQAVATCFSKYIAFQGRASRSEFWWFALFCAVVMVVVLGAGAAILEDSAIPAVVACLFALGIALPGLSVTVRRLHDTDKSGWWYFIQLVPAIGGIWFLVLMVSGSTPGPNRFGG